MTLQLSLLGAAIAPVVDATAGTSPASLRSITLADERFVRRKVNRVLGSPPFPWKGPFIWHGNILIEICGDLGAPDGADGHVRKLLASVGIYPGAAGWQVDDPRPWLVGESNPYLRPEDPPHHFDLWPEPKNATGDRLCRLVLGMEKTAYLRNFVRRDLLAQTTWSVPKARAAAERVLAESGRAPLVLLGAKVSAAFGLLYAPFTRTEHKMDAGMRTVVIIPHPSGLSRGWFEPDAYRRARDLILPLIPSEKMPPAETNSR